MEFIRKCYGRAILLARWLFLAGIAGVILGIFGGLFGNSITYVTAFRNAHPWMLYLLPAAGLAIVALYKLDPYKTGTNRVLEGIQSDTYVPLRMAPLIVVSTILTHAFGGSAGREGAALQLGGSIGGTLGKWMKFDEYHDHVWHERRIFSVVRNAIDGNRIRYGSDQCGDHTVCSTGSLCSCFSDSTSGCNPGWFRRGDLYPGYGTGIYADQCGVSDYSCSFMCGSQYLFL